MEQISTMAFDNEDALCEKHNKLDPTLSNGHSVHSLNSLFPKVDNLEYFPLKILLQIFASVNDTTMLNLAESSTRFESIAKMVLNERYAHKYFTIDPTKDNPPRYDDFIQLFGSKIKAVEVIDTTIEGKKHYIVSQLNRAYNLEKLKLNITCSENESFLQKYVSSSITHLTLRIRFYETKDGFVLSKFRNLRKLELMDSPCISFETLREVIFNNRGLEGLCISDEYKYLNEEADILRVYPFDELMMLFGAARLNQFKEFAYILLHHQRDRLPDIQIKRQPVHTVNAFVRSLKHLESLALSFIAVNFFTDVVKLFHRLASRCKNIKHLKLYHIEDSYVEIFESIKSIKRIESLLITMYSLEYELIVSLIQNLPLLHHLHIEFHDEDVDWSFVLTVVSKCPSLEKLTIASDNLGCDFELLTSAQFFDEFKNCIQIRNVEIIGVCGRDWQDYEEPSHLAK